MKFTLTLILDNAEFWEEPPEGGIQGILDRPALARAIHRTAESVEAMPREDEGRAFDGNGNSVGSWMLEAF